MSVVAIVSPRIFFISWASTLTERRYKPPPQAVGIFFLKNEAARI